MVAGLLVSRYLCVEMPCKPRGDSHLFQLSNLFRYAHGDVRCVKLQHPRDDFYYCIADVLRCVCEVGAERATEIWKTLPDKMKQELQGGSVTEFNFHRTAIPVATYNALKKIISEVRGHKADRFRMLHPDIFEKAVVSTSPSPSPIPFPPSRPTMPPTQSNLYTFFGRGSESVTSDPGGDCRMDFDKENEPPVGMDCDPPMEEAGCCAKEKKRKAPANIMHAIRSRCEFTNNLMQQYKLAQDTIQNFEHRERMCAELIKTLHMLPDAEDAFAAEAKASVGFVYCLVSDAYPNRVKIGRSKNVEERLSALNTGCAPKPLRVALTVKTLHPARDEKRTHTFFAAVRREGEYFQTSVAEVKAFFDAQIVPEYIKELEAAAGI